MKLRHLLGATGVSCLLFLGAAAPAFAANTGSSVNSNASVTGGDRTATLAGDITFPAVNESHSDQLATAQSTSVEVNDLSGTDAGWNVTIVASNLTGSNGGTIPADNVSLDSVDTLSSISGSTTGTTPGETGGDWVGHDPIVRSRR